MMWRDVARRGVWGALCLCLAPAVLAQEAEPTCSGLPAAAKNFKYTGYRKCGECHVIPTAPNGFVLRTEAGAFLTDADVEFYKQILPGVAMPEKPFRDKHALAYEMLSSDLGKQILQTLDIKLDDVKAQQCMSCHANWLAGHDKPPEFSRGVSCESCHGPAEQWLAPHDDLDWRKVKPDEKAAKGLIDVRNPVTRAKQCLTCHIGCAEEGKVVTHEMYAAGHPPLPGFDVEAFAAQMPSHWRPLRQKGDFELRKEYIEANFPGRTEEQVDNDLPQTRAVLVGSVIALRTSIALLKEQSAASQTQNSEVAWPEFAVFDCSACHHDLKSKSWRQERGYAGTRPGRPQLPAWTYEIIDAAVATAKADAKDLDAKLEAVKAELTRRPFGDPKSLQTVCDPAIRTLDDVAAKLATMTFTPADALAIVERLKKLDASHFADFHGARQIAWAILTIETERAAPGPEGLKARAENETEDQATLRMLANRKAYLEWKEKTYFPARKSTLGRLEDQAQLESRLKLDLPAGQTKSVAGFQPEYLQQVGDYDADWFRKQLLKLKLEK